MTNYCLLLIIALFPISTLADRNTSLYDEILEADQIFFDAFNQCDVATMAKMFDTSLEFYHDKGGLGDYASTMKVTKENCDKKLGLKRTLDKKTLKVFPVPNYGAIQEASHKFCHVVNGKDDCGNFKFIHVWKRVDEHWKLTRVISYDH